MKSTKIFGGIIAGFWVAIGAMLMVVALVGLTELLMYDKLPKKLAVAFMLPVWFLVSGLAWGFFQDVIKEEI